MKGIYKYGLIWIGIVLAATTVGGTITDGTQTVAVPEADVHMAKTKKKSKPPPPPIKIFIMAGQSNTEGHGFMNKTNDDGTFLPGTLEWMVESDPESYGKLKINKSENNSSSWNWTERDDVYINYNLQNWDSVHISNKDFEGKLTAGYGYERNEIGPELGFGWTIGDYYASGSNNDSDSDSDIDGDDDTPKVVNVLLVKTAWGGRDLAKHFRPPSSPGTTGVYYVAMIALVYKTLSRLPDIVPGYTQDRGYTLEGFAWHQGYNDGMDRTDYANEYESNLANLIRDVRADLGVPDLPFVVGVTGMLGWDATAADPNHNSVAEAQLAVADPELYPEFEATVATAETRDFYRDVDQSPGTESFHWNNNCESYWLVGKAMGDAMIDLVGVERVR